MRVGFILPCCTTDNSHGGYVLALARHLAVDYEVHIFSGAFAGVPERVVCHWLPVPNRPAVLRLSTLWSLAPFVARTVPLDIVHVQGADAPVGAVVTAQCCNAALKAFETNNGFIRSANSILGQVAEFWCYRRGNVKKIIAISQKVEQELESYVGVSKEKLTVIYHGVDLNRFYPRPQERHAIRRRYGIPEEDFVIAFVGGNYRLKGLQFLLQALTLLPSDIHVFAIGVLSNSSLTSKVEELGLDGRVHFTGNISEIQRYYAASDCFVLPTHYDAFSMATLEAMASGLPVIVSRHAGVTELLTDEQDSFILVEPKDHEEISAKLERLWRDRSLRDYLAQNARHTAEAHPWERTVKETIKVYEQLVY